MASLSPLLTATPTTPPTYNVGMAETFSWVPVEGAGRPLYARAAYLANPQDIKVSLSAGDLNINLDQIELNTDEVETILRSLTALTQAEFNETQTLLDTLTALQNSKQEEIVTLLHQLTANTDSLEINTDNVESLISNSNVRLDALTAVDYATEAKQDSSITLLRQLTANTDSIESLLQTSNSLLDSISAKEMTISLDVSAINLNTDEIEGLIETSNTLLDALTAKVTVTDVSGIETRLDVLTAVDYATSNKQDSIITLLDALTAKETTISLDVSAINLNTDEIEGLIETSNTLLNALTAKQTVTDVSGIETRLDVLTAVDYATSTKQDSVITLLDALTAVQFATSPNQDTANTLLNSLTALQEDKQDQIITLLHAVTGTSFDVDLTTDQINLNIDQVETLLNDLTGTNIKVPGFSIPPYDEIDLSYYGSTNNLASVSYINNSTAVLSLSFVYVSNPPTSNDALLVNVKKI